RRRRLRNRPAAAQTQGDIHETASLWRAGGAFAVGPGWRRRPDSRRPAVARQAEIDAHQIGHLRFAGLRRTPWSPPCSTVAIARAMYLFSFAVASAGRYFRARRG